MFLAALALWELILLGLFGVLFLAMLAAEKEGVASLFLGLAIGLIVWAGWDPVKEFFAQPGAARLAAKWVAIYLGAGLAFAVLKWVLYSRKKAAQYLSEAREWEDRRVQAITKLDADINLYSRWLGASPEERKSIELPYRYHNTNEYEVTKALDDARDKQKTLMKETYLTSNGSTSRTFGIIMVKQDEDGSAITKIDLAKLGGYVSAWASYWPAYALLLVLDDFLRAAWDAVTQGLRRVFQAITRWAFKV